MRLLDRIGSLLSHPANRVLGLVMLGVDIATVVGWLRDDDGRPMNIDMVPVYAFVLTVSIPLTAFFLWGWWTTTPLRLHNQFKAAYGDIAETRDVLRSYFDESGSGLVADSRYTELVRTVQPFGIDLPGMDDSGVIDRGERWFLLNELAACAKVGDIKAACDLVVGVRESAVFAGDVACDVGGDDAECADPDQHQHRGDDASGGGDWCDVAVADGGDGDE